MLVFVEIKLINKLKYLISRHLFIPNVSMYTHISAFGDVFSSIGVREPQPAASEAFTCFGEAHRNMEKFSIKMLKTVKPVRYLSIWASSFRKLTHLKNLMPLCTWALNTEYPILQFISLEIVDINVKIIYFRNYTTL